MPENKSNTGSLKSKVSYAKAYAKARAGKALTSAQRMALKKAQEASARARSMLAKSGGNTSALRAKMAVSRTVAKAKARGKVVMAKNPKAVSAVKKVVTSAKQTVNKNLQRAGLQSTGAGAGPKGRAKVIGKAGNPTSAGPKNRARVIGPAGNPTNSSGPSRRPRGNGMGMQVSRQADLMTRRGAPRASALRTAKNYVKTNRKNKK